LAASLAAGCSQLPSHDDSYKTDIPAALEAASLGISDAYADVSLDGFTETLTVGGTVDLPAAEETKASPDFVRDVIRVALDGRVLNMRYLDVAFRDSDNQKIDVKSALTRLGAAPSTTARASPWMRRGRSPRGRDDDRSRSTRRDRRWRTEKTGRTGKTPRTASSRHTSEPVRGDRIAAR